MVRPLNLTSVKQNVLRTFFFFFCVFPTWLIWLRDVFNLLSFEGFFANEEKCCCCLFWIWHNSSHFLPSLLIKWRNDAMFRKIFREFCSASKQGNYFHTRSNSNIRLGIIQIIRDTFLILTWAPPVTFTFKPSCLSDLKALNCETN